MGHPAEKKEYFTLDEYLAFEATAEGKHEFENGLILAMSGGTVNHGRLSKNMLRAIDDRISNRGNGCEAFGSDVRVQIEGAKSYVYPDASMVCGEIEYHDEAKNGIKNPVLVVEVLSDSTEGYDRGQKFVKYRQLPSLREYVLVSQDRPRVDVFYRQENDTWIMTSVSGLDSSIYLNSLDETISLAEIYRNVEDLLEA